ncbi:U7 snRNA-associated Sm-like protein LSm10 [Anopheles marshallii]|uniref:U7 snRNA-associated Sm-like protein LSm10 n=1 Tax=Anopheles marshallii TaxID=1521116 RepID=UPI00237AFB4B|nr:U7 snRNA-associated Sm-like protein LSm10 [Anopheles marshallii]
MDYKGKEKYNAVNYVTGFAQCLIDRNTLIDLQNETSVAGTIVDVDGFMNVTMENAVYIDQLGRQYLLDNFVVYSKYIRYIHIPKDMNIVASFEHYLNSTTVKKKPVDRKLTFRQKRAMQSNLETMVENNMV